MAKHKVLILGGGMAGLTTAHHLSRTPEQRARYDVTVASLGWRLGGKLASGREASPPNRSHEHGLHVWFGFYDNAFALLREVYERWDKPASCPFRTWDAVVRPQSFTPIGGAVDGRETPWPLRWAENPGVPGDGHLGLSPWESFVELLNVLELIIEDGLRAGGGQPEEASFTQELLERFGLDAGSVPVRTATGLLRFARDSARQLVDDSLEADARRAAAAFVSALLAAFQVALEALVGGLTPGDVNGHDLLALTETGCAFARGILNPAYGVVEDADLDRIDHLEFRDFLVENGCDPEVAHHWRGIRALYDCCFQYVDGDVTRPDFAAGTAARVVLRIVTQYKGAVLWLFNAGVGESVIAPIYEVLVDQGVRFRFFHEAKELKLSPDRSRVAEVVLHEQVKTKTGAPYEPLFEAAGFRCWPTEPFWDQLEDGASLRARGVDFESPWGDKPAGADHVWRHGVDFDTVVLATPLGPCMKLNATDRSLVEDILAFDDGWQRMIETTGLAPSLALELWMKPDLAGLGWPSAPPAAVGIPYPAAVWADMTQVLEVETWPDAAQPGSLHYFCGTLGTQLFREPRAAVDVQARALAETDAALQPFLDERLAALWPAATAPGTRRIDPAKVAFRHVRANVSPSECCETTPAGSTQWKMAADRSGFKNLVLAGAWVRTGINASCVEAAVMSGMQASRAISRFPRQVVGEEFWHHFPEDRPSHRRLPRFVSRLGHGEQAVEPPGIVRGARTFCWFVPATRAAMQRSVDQFLNAPARGAVEYEVLGDRALLSFLDGRALTSLVEPMGFIADREMALWIPLLQKKRGHWLPDPVLWMPYVVVDQSIACITGRELWGFLKEVGPVSFPGDAGADGSFRANAMTFLDLDPNVRGEVRTLLRVHHPSGLAGQQSGASGASATGAAVLDDAVGLLGGIVDGAILRKLLTASVPLVNLKQFRDARRPDRACYQALIESSCRVETLRSVTLLQDDHRLDVLPCRSHQIVEDLGLASSTGLALGPGLVVDMDFSIQPGEEIWRA